MLIMDRPTQKASISTLFLKMVEPATLLLFVSLMYKQQVLGILCMVIMAIPGLLIRKPIRILDNQVALFSILYVFMATVTAYLVGFKDGIYRSIQFVFLVFALFGLVKFWYISLPKERMRFCKRFSILISLVFVHMILYHLFIGKFTTWKYLYDTKTSISLLAVLIFTFINPIKDRFGVWSVFCLIGLFGVLVLLSGERKAYLLLGILFLFSTIPFRYKIVAGMSVVALGSIFLISAPDDSYVKKQISSSIGLSSQSGGQYENYGHRDLELVQGLGYQSDLIRKYVNENARTLFAQNPILGLGSGGYIQWANQKYGIEYTAFGIKTGVHGEINRVPVESGIAGILISSYCFILFIWGAAKVSFRNGIHGITSTRLFPVYFLSFLIIYCLFEAMDTNMLAMILTFGLFLSMEVKLNVKGRKHHL